MPSNFPNNPSIGTTHTIDSITWEWNGVAWVALGGTGATLSLNNLTDVTITMPVENQILKYNGSEWNNSSAVDGGSF